MTKEKPVKKKKTMEEKEKFENLKKTAEASGTVSEEVDDKITEKMIEKVQKKEEELSEEKAREKRIQMDKEEAEKAEALVEKEKEKEIVAKNRQRRGEKTREEIVSAWEPKTKLGIEVKTGKIKNIDEVLDNKRKILEQEIVDALMIIESDLFSIGQSKGKFGGGKRRAWRQTQKKKKEGNIPTFSTLAVVGDRNGHVGIGSGRAKETLPARAKAIRKAKLNVIKITRGCASFDCSCTQKHTVPFEVTGKSGSIRVTLIPAPQGTGLVVGNELKKVLSLAGIKDVYSKSFGSKRTTFNFVKACMDALEKTNTGANKK
jgi:small subunit ribosomal protein S5